MNEYKDMCVILLIVVVIMIFIVFFLIGGQYRSDTGSDSETRIVIPAVSQHLVDS